ncbi:MAG TPA: hypothetical protein VLA16_17865 [Ideonella sp.]|nr:hypothetical protein [Ideonella sp.]
MNTPLKTQASRLLFAVGLAVGAIAAHAAGGVSVVPSQESLVQPGMSQAEVKQALGRPARHEKFMNEQGPTWTYDVATVETDGQTLFDVDFGADGKVVSATERIVESN